MKLRFRWIWIFVPFYGFSQDPIEIKDIPAPYQPKPYFDDINNTGVKNVLLLSSKKGAQLKADTMYKFHYNRNGQKDSSIRYELNQLSNKTILSYDQYNQMTQWVIFDKDGLETTTKFYYNPNRQLDSTRQLMIKKGKIIQSSNFKYAYQNRQLINKQIIMNDVVNRSDSFSYSGDLLKQYKSELSPLAYFVSSYIYNSDSTLQKKDIIHYYGSKKEAYNNKCFFYENKQLVFEEEITYDNKQILTHYTYDSLKKLHQIISNYEQNNRTVEFEYNDFAIKQVTVRTNSNNAYLKYYIPLSLNNISFPLNYVEQYEYDSRKNLISKKHYIENELVQEEKYIIEYYP